jgi:uncharacterized protein (TIGR00725 family)
MPRPVVAVVGPAQPDDAAVLAAAREVGAGLAAAGCTIVTGGLGGVMTAAAQGAHEAGGFVVGVLPGEDPSAANDYVDLPVPTGLGEGRNILVVRMAQVVVSVGGSWGTLAEVALARRRWTPVVSLMGWQVVGPAADRDVLTVSTAADAVRAVIELLSGSPTDDRTR